MTDKKAKLTYFYLMCMFMAACILLSACQRKAEIQDTPDLGTSSVSETEPENEIKEEVEAEEPEEMHRDFLLRDLTPEEVAFFNDYLSSAGNWGFLLSTYDSPKKVDLEEVFYSGVGISDGYLTEEQAEDYLNASGGAEIYTDVVHLTTTEINDFLLKKTGLTLAQMENGLSWTYSEKTDTWYHQAGDINWRPFECVGGEEMGDIYYLYVKAADVAPGYRAELYETVLKKNGDEYQFVSNRFMEEEGKIADRSLDLTLNDLGDVTFVAYMPEKDGEPTADVTFRIIQNGKLLRTLSGVTYENTREGQYFLSVDAVSFLDINSDGYMDIITIVSYGRTPDADPNDSFAEARVYSESEMGYLSYNSEMTEVINSALVEVTLDNVLDFWGIER